MSIARTARSRYRSIKEAEEEEKKKHTVTGVVKGILKKYQSYLTK